MLDGGTSNANARSTEKTRWTAKPEGRVLYPKPWTGDVPSHKTRAAEEQLICSKKERKKEKNEEITRGQT